MVEFAVECIITQAVINKTWFVFAKGQHIFSETNTSYCSLVVVAVTPSRRGPATICCLVMTNLWRSEQVISSAWLEPHDAWKGNAWQALVSLHHGPTITQLTDVWGCGGVCVWGGGGRLGKRVCTLGNCVQNKETFPSTKLKAWKT